eukprot:124422-Rhodomonas_salina.2
MSTMVVGCWEERTPHARRVLDFDPQSPCLILEELRHFHRIVEGKPLVVELFFRLAISQKGIPAGPTFIGSIFLGSDSLDWPPNKRPAIAILGQSP